MHLCCQSWCMACNVLLPSDGQQRPWRWPIALRPHIVFGCHTHTSTHTQYVLHMHAEFWIVYWNDSKTQHRCSCLFISHSPLSYAGFARGLWGSGDLAEFTLREDAREEKSKFLFLDVPANLCGQGTLRKRESLSRCFTWRTRTNGASHMCNKAHHPLT